MREDIQRAEEERRAIEVPEPPPSPVVRELFFQLAGNSLFWAISFGVLPGPGVLTQVAYEFESTPGGGGGEIRVEYGIRLVPGAFTYFFQHNSPSAFNMGQGLTDANTIGTSGQLVDNIVQLQAGMNEMYSLYPNLPIASVPVTPFLGLRGITIVAPGVIVTIKAQLVFAPQTRVPGVERFLRPVLLRLPRIIIPPPPSRTPWGIPRAVKIRVMQAGGVLAERVVPWAALDPALQAEAAGYAVTGNWPPTMVPIY